MDAIGVALAPLPPRAPWQQGECGFEVAFDEHLQLEGGV